MNSDYLYTREDWDRLLEDMNRLEGPQSSYCDMTEKEWDGFMKEMDQAFPKKEHSSSDFFVRELSEMDWRLE